MKPETIATMQEIGVISEEIIKTTAEIDHLRGVRSDLEARAEAKRKELREGPDAAEVKAIYGIRERKSRKATTSDGSSPAPAKKRGKKTEDPTSAEWP